MSHNVKCLLLDFNILDTKLYKINNTQFTISATYAVLVIYRISDIVS